VLPCAVLCCAVLCSQGPEKRAEYGIKDNLVRFSCGVEDVEDIWDDLAQALEKI
jgi:cystathionine gamma-synthase